MMQITNFFYIVILVALSCPETLFNVQAKGDDVKLNEKDNLNGFYKNICDVTDRQSQVHCYCENTTDLGNAIKAECWVFNEGIPYDDLIWQSFASQPNLKTLSFNVRLDGALHYIPTKALLFLTVLSSINIKYGSIEEVRPYALANLTYLKEVKITSSGIKILQDRAISHLPNLSILNLESNMIIEISSDLFFDLPKLQKLTFSKNNISVIKDGAFQYLFNLLEIDLDKNNIHRLNRHTFNGLANLRRLDLQNNHIQNLSEFTFVELWNLKELLLGKNHVEFISERAFDGLSQLEKLSLDQNKIFEIPLRLLEGVRGLNYLDLRSNKLQTLTFDNIKPILDNLNLQNSGLHLEDNNFKCHCSLNWIYQLHNSTSSSSTINSLNNIKCTIKLTTTAEKFMTNELDYNQDILHAGLTIEIGNKNMTSPRFKYNNTNSNNKVNILRIPAEELPCPEVTTRTPSVEPPAVFVQKEIKSYYRLDTDSGAENNYVSKLIISVSLCILRKV